MLLLVTSLCVIAVVFIVRTYKNRRLPPGPFRFPIIGSIPQLAIEDMTFPHKAFHQLAKKYGDLMSVGVGVHYMVIVSSYDYIKELFAMAELSKRYPLPFAKDRNFGKEDMGIGLTDRLDLKHYTMRKLKDLGLRAKTFLDPLFQQEAAELIRTIRQNITSDGIWAVSTDIISVSTLNVTWAFMAGFRFSFDNPLLLEAVRGNEQVLHAIGIKNKYTAFPFLKTWFPKWSGHLDHMKAFRQLRGVLLQMINDLKEKEVNAQTEESFIRRFLKEIENADESNRDMFNEDQLIAILSDIFLAGTESSSNAINWILLHLCLNPEVQDKVYDEILRQVGKDGLLTLADESQMPYTKAVMYETLRVSNFVPLSFPRLVPRDIEIGGYVIPKGTGLIYNLTGVFNEQKHWGDPEAFRPERFIDFDEYGIPARLKGTERVIQFGIGKRMCPGEALGINMVFFFLTSLLQEFKFSVIPGKIPTTDTVCRISFRAEQYSVKLENRK